MDFLTKINLAELATGERTGKHFLSPGSPVPGGLCAEAAKAMGVPVGLPVGASLIDAHAGALGLLTCLPDGLPDVQVCR